MTLIESLRAHLLADPAVSAIVGPRVYPIVTPAASAAPHIVLRRAGLDADDSLDTQESVVRRRIEAMCIATSYGGAVSLAEAVAGIYGESGMNGWTNASDPAVLSCRLSDENDSALLPDDGSADVLYVVTQTYTIETDS